MQSLKQTTPKPQTFSQFKQIKPNTEYLLSHSSNNNSINISHSNMNNRDKNNDFSFLMKSIERQKFNTFINVSNTNGNKENYQSNQVNQGRYSINNNKTLFHNTQHIQIKNVNMTKSTIVNSFLISKQKQKQKDYKDKQTSYNKIIQSMVYKIKKYLSITDPILNKTNQIKIQQKLRKQGIHTARQLIEIVTNYEQYKANQNNRQKQQYYGNLNNSSNLALGSNKSLSSSYHFPNGVVGIVGGQDSVNFIKKIQNLQQQKMHLQSLISQHQRRNIKMFIKLNQGQSQQIQKYKKMLASLYQKYKQLQKLVQKYSQKSKLLQNKLEQYKNPKCTKLCQVNVGQLKKKINTLEQVINQQNQCLAKALQEIQMLRRYKEQFQSMEIEYQAKLAQLQKIQRNKQQVHRMSPLNNSDLAKSTCSGDQGFDSSFNTRYQHSRSIHSDAQEMFSNIMLKPTTSNNNNTISNIMKVDDNILRMLLVQANLIQQVVSK